MAMFVLSDLMSSNHLNHKVDFEQLFKDSKNAGLRDYQIASKRRIYTAWQTCRSVMLQMPTGTGKTRLFADIVKDLCLWGKRHQTEIKILILAHKRELIDQISDTLEDHHIAHGIIMSQHRQVASRSIQVGSVPTLNRRLDKWGDNDFDIIIIDEAHHVKAKSYRDIIKLYPEAKILGVTATPYRLNGAGFRPEFDKLVISWPIREFIRRGYLSDFTYCSIVQDSLLQTEISQMKIDDKGDYMDAEMMNVMNRPNIRAEIVNTYIKFAKGKKGIVYTVNQDHNKCLKEQFESVGIRAEMIDSKTPKDERDKIVGQFRRERFDVLCNVNIFSEGFDCPDVEFIQLARPTRSLAMYLQQVGRGLRPSNGKRLIVLDNVGLVHCFGLPDVNRNWRAYFEGKNYVEEIDLQHGMSNEDMPRDIIPIEEGHEEVVMLYETDGEQVKTEEDSIYEQLNLEDEIDIAITKAEQEYRQREFVINYSRDNGYDIPQKLMEDFEKYKTESKPTLHIKKNVEDYIAKHFNKSQYVNFVFSMDDKDSLEEEMEKIILQKDNIQDELEEINQTISGYTTYIKSTPPNDLIINKEKCLKKLKVCDGKLEFLLAIEKRFRLLSKYDFKVIFAKGQLIVE